MNDQAGLSQGQVISSWYLNKIQSADGVFSINFTYTAEAYSFYTISTFPIQVASSGLEYSIVKNMVTGVKLDKIIASNATIEILSYCICLKLYGSV